MDNIRLCPFACEIELLTGQSMVIAQNYLDMRAMAQSEQVWLDLPVYVTGDHEDETNTEDTMIVQTCVRNLSITNVTEMAVEEDVMLDLAEKLNKDIDE
jgi:hypothetical protein